ncbi:hypothetical protein ACFW93_01550 [Streptomyces canus]|uniref:hypothetical protein n=1 Tax=Streptomyces canus TaxID=58343 RepID=UPI0036D203A9
MTSLDALDSCPRGDQFLAVLARCFDQGGEHRYVGLAEDVGDALVDAVVEGGGVRVDRVVHRLGAGQVLHVHGDVEDGSAGAVSAGLQLGAVVEHEGANGCEADFEVRRHHRRSHVHPVRQ